MAPDQDTWNYRRRRSEAQSHKPPYQMYSAPPMGTQYGIRYISKPVKVTRIRTWCVYVDAGPRKAILFLEAVMIAAKAYGKCRWRWKSQSQWEMDYVIPYIKTIPKTFKKNSWARNRQTLLRHDSRWIFFRTCRTTVTLQLHVSPAAA